MTASRQSRRRRINASLTVGRSFAEADDLLSTAYVEFDDYETLASKQDRTCFVVGRTGSGKSAALRHLEEVDPEHVVRIQPENLSLPYLTNLDVIQQMRALDVRLEPFLKALWKHILLVEIIRHRYGIQSPEDRDRILGNLRERLRRDSSKRLALDYLREFGDRFWCETDERVRQVAQSFRDKAVATGALSIGAAGVGASLGASSEREMDAEVRTELRQRYHVLVNDTQLPRLNQMINVLNDDILDSPGQFRYVVIDDLDKDWVDEDIAILLIRTLFDAVIDMLAVQNLKVLVALRTNIFGQLGYESQRRGNQVEKIENASLELSWTRSELKSVLDRRLRSGSVKAGIDPPYTLEDLLPKGPSYQGDTALEYIFGRTLDRPRDAIEFLNRCLRLAARETRTRLVWSNILGVEVDYSVSRREALRDEWKDPYMGIDRVLEVFRGAPTTMSLDEYITLLEDVMLLADGLPETAWLAEHTRPIWKALDEGRKWPEPYWPLTKLLYDTAFIGITMRQGGRPRYRHLDANELTLEDLNAAVNVVVHPAFQSGLEMKVPTVEVRA